MRSKLLLLVALAFVGGGVVGCTKTPILLMVEHRPLLKNPPFYSMYNSAPQFYYASRGEQTTAFLGGFLVGLLFLPIAMAMESSHDDLVGLYHLENPSLAIEQDLAQRIAKEYELKDIRPKGGGAFWSDPEDLKRLFVQGVFLEVRTAQWGGFLHLHGRSFMSC
ncbi:MAG: hypothetical protein U0236_01795 [Nitrospira sp.]